jgi:hypothetical protein
MSNAKTQNPKSNSQSFRHRSLGVGIWFLGFFVALSGCAPRLLRLPTDPGAPAPDFLQTYRTATAACSGVKTLTAELGLSGRAGGRRIRGRAIIGVERPASLRLEGVAPFGPPAFILAARAGAGTLLLPRDDRVLRDTPPQDILGALTGVALNPADLQAVLTGCLVAGGEPTDGRLHQNGWIAVDLPGEATLYLERRGTQWQPRAGRRPGWQIEYAPSQGDFPQDVRLRSVNPAVDVDLSASIGQLETNLAIDPAAFAVDVPPGALPITLAELRDAGPLGGE